MNPGQGTRHRKSVYLVASGYNHPTYIMNPSGEWLAVAREQGAAAIATIDLSKSLRQPNNNLGDMRKPASERAAIRCRHRHSRSREVVHA